MEPHRYTREAGGGGMAAPPSPSTPSPPAARPARPLARALAAPPPPPPPPRPALARPPVPAGPRPRSPARPPALARPRSRGYPDGMAGMPIRRARRAALAEALARASDPAALAEALALAENARALPSRSTRDAPGRAGTRTQTPVAARLSAEVAGERWARRSLSVALAEEDLAWLELEAARVAAAVGRRVSAGEGARAIVRRAVTARPDP